MPTPTELNLHQQSRILEITFDDGSHFNLPCEYLRVYSPSAEVQGHGPGQRVLQLGKEDVGVDKIEPVGNYAICLHFDDQHNTGIYSWEYLYKLGVEQEHLWKEYLDELEKAGQKRKSGRPDVGEDVLYPQADRRDHGADCRCTACPMRRHETFCDPASLRRRRMTRCAEPRGRRHTARPGLITSASHASAKRRPSARHGKGTGDGFVVN
jgi:DUF971 family protein